MGHANEYDAGRRGLATVTSTTLLEGLKKGDNRTIWSEFSERYRPLILKFAGRLGLAADDAEDVAQASLLGFSQAYLGGKYDRGHGRLREWLFGIVRNQVSNWRRRVRHREVQVADTGQQRDVLNGAEARESFEELWDEEWRAAVMRQCLQEVRREVSDTTFRAFERFALLGESVDEVAQALGLTPNAVYGAKRRVLRRIREVRPLLEDIW